MTGANHAAEFWEDHYAGAGRVWSGRVNGVLASIAAGLSPGRALDLGCGEGADVVWLAQQGWQVTGVDLSPTAIARGMAAAAEAGIREDRIELIAADLSTWSGDDDYDLVAASFLQSWPVPMPRAEILRRATGFVAPGGHLLIVAHAAAPSWAPAGMVDEHRFPQPVDDLASLALDPGRWTVVSCETRSRPVTAPDGRSAQLLDGIVLVRRDR